MLSFDFWNFIFMIINLLILYVLMKKFLFGRVDDILAKRKEQIEEDYTAAGKMKVETEELRNQYNDRMKAIDSEREKILQDSSKRAADEYDRLVKEAKAEAASIIDRARQEAGIVQDAALREQEKQIEQLVFDAASKISAAAISAEDNRKLYDSFLAQAFPENEPQGKAAGGAQ